MILFADIHNRLIYLLLNCYPALAILLADYQTVITLFQSEIFGKHLPHHTLLLDLIP